MEWINNNWLDAALLISLAGFVFYGLFFGLIKTVGSLAGLLAGAWAANRWYLWLFAWARSLAFGHDNIGRVVSFLLCFMIVNRLVGLLFAVLDRVFKLMSIVPFLKTINRLGGLLLGFFEGGVALGLLLLLVGSYAPAANWLSGPLSHSQLAPFLTQTAATIKPLVSGVLAELSGGK